jgi:hypothetical protein
MTVLYRGNLSDTATLVGLAHMRTPVTLIAFTGELSAEVRKYCQLVSRWLVSKGLPEISIHPNMLSRDLERVLDSPNKDWGWGDRECEAAVRLAGLPLPPSLVS